MGTNDSIIEVRDLRKRFPKRRKKNGESFWSKLLPGRREPQEWLVAVDGISFDIQRGEIFGLLGPNGAGKTTTIKMLCTLLEPTSGTARVHGYDITKQSNMVRQNLGAVLKGERSIYWKLTGRENLEYFAALYHIPQAAARRQIAELLDRFSLKDKADELVERYSSGMKQRLAIAKAMLANPPVLLLDEPTVGLDPQSARNLRDLVLEIKQEGRTVLLTTHYMEEADLLSDRVAVIDLGRIIALDTPTHLKDRVEQLDIVQLEVENMNPTLTTTMSAWSVSLHTVDSRAILPTLIEVIGADSARIKHLQIAEPTLEDVFISLTGKQLRD
jgi:ABC-2 type transport system ATP-binding protein